MDGRFIKNMTSMYLHVHTINAERYFQKTI